MIPAQSKNEAEGKLSPFQRKLFDYEWVAMDNMQMRLSNKNDSFYSTTV